MVHGLFNPSNFSQQIQLLPTKPLPLPYQLYYMTTEQTTYDAIVIGSGISGGWAAKELCELGLKTLVLERGRNVDHIKDYPTATMDPWQFKHRAQMTLAFLKENPYISKAAGLGEEC